MKKVVVLFFCVAISGTLMAQLRHFKSTLLPVSLEFSGWWEAKDDKASTSIKIDRLSKNGVIKIKTTEPNLKPDLLIATTKYVYYYEKGVQLPYYDLKEGTITINGLTAYFVEAVYNARHKELTGKTDPTVEVHYFIQKNNVNYYLYASVNNAFEEETRDIIKTFKVQ